MGDSPCALTKKAASAVGGIITLQAGTTRCLLHAKTANYQGKKMFQTLRRPELVAPFETTGGCVSFPQQSVIYHQKPFQSSGNCQKARNFVSSDIFRINRILKSKKQRQPEIPGQNCIMYIDFLYLQAINAEIICFFIYFSNILNIRLSFLTPVKSGGYNWFRLRKILHNLNQSAIIHRGATDKS